jgi:hypothetical protein
MHDIQTTLIPKWRRKLTSVGSQCGTINPLAG